MFYKGEYMLKKIVLIMASLLCFSTLAHAEKAFVVAVPATVPPLAFVAEDGALSGYSVDYLKAVAKAGGFTLELKTIPWNGIFAGLVSGKYDAICGAVSITEKRKNVVDFSDPYLDLQQALAVAKDSTVKTLADLKGEKVGGKFGSTGFMVLKDVEGLEYTGYPELSSLMQALHAGEVAAIVYDAPQVYHAISSTYSETLKVASTLPAASQEQLAIAVKKGNVELLALLNKGIAAVSGSAQDTEMHKKWLGR